MATTYYILNKLRKKRLSRKLRHQLYEKPDILLDDLPTCRICLKEASIPILGDEIHINITDEVRIFGNVEISKDDNYPKHLCEMCNSLLQGAILFRKKAKETESILLRNSPNSESPPVDHFLSYTGEETEESMLALYSEYPSEAGKSYCCKLCKKSFKTNEEYARHRSSKEHKNVRIQCSMCNRLLTPQLYEKHLLRHQTASHLICEVCGKLYRKDNLIRHLQLHSFALPFQCQQCPYRGRFMESLRIHMRTHTGDKPFSCDKCQLRFLTRSNLNRHLLTHRKERPFKCHECGRGFYSQCDVDVHFKADHVGIKDFCCRMCGSKYGTRKALMRHELRVHKRDKMAKGRVPLYLRSEYRRQFE